MTTNIASWNDLALEYIIFHDLSYSAINLGTSSFRIKVWNGWKLLGPLKNWPKLLCHFTLQPSCWPILESQLPISTKSPPLIKIWTHFVASVSRPSLISNDSHPVRFCRFLLQLELEVHQYISFNLNILENWTKSLQLRLPIQTNGRYTVYNRFNTTHKKDRYYFDWDKEKKRNIYFNNPFNVCRMTPPLWNNLIS